MSELGPLCKYKDEYDDSIVEHARNGLGMYEIAVEYDVAYETMRNWTRLVKSFSDSYRRAKTIQTAMLEKEVKNNWNNPKYNDRLAKLRYQYEAKFADQRNVCVKGLNKGTYTDRVNAILEACENEELSADELGKLVTAVGTAAKIDEVTELRKQVEDLESKE